MAADVVIVSGEGRYADPWHDFAGTSQQMAQILTTAGLDVVVCGSDTTDPQQARLLVVNTGGGIPQDGRRPEAVPGDRASAWHEAVLVHAHAGGPVLAVHAATNSLYDDDRWPQVLGGRWVPGTSMHPPRGQARVEVADVEHPITAGLPHELEIVDERYSFLDLQPQVLPLVTQEHDGVVHPIVWVNPTAPGRVVVDTLGHDVAAYGAVRADLLRREVDWLLR